MKKLTAVLLIALLVFSLAGCGNKEVDLAALSGELKSASGRLFTEVLEPQGEQSMQSWVKVDLSLVDNYEFYAAAGYTGEEYGLFACKSQNDAKTLVAQLEQRVQDLKNTYESYAPDAVLRLNDPLIKQLGVYVVYVVSDNQSEARKIVDQYI